jgi:hypothetical protein
MFTNHQTNHPNQLTGSNPMFSNHPYVSQQLVRDRQERFRRISQNTHLRHEPRRSWRRQHTQT